MKPLAWRLASDYVGAGKFVLLPDRVIVGTEYGVQCVPRPAPGVPRPTTPGSSRPAAKGVTARPREAGPEWALDLGSRCVGIMAGRGDLYVAACVKGLFVLSETGEERWGTHSLKDIVHAPVAFRDGVLLTTSAAIHYIQEWNGPNWRFDFSEALGTSVEAIRLINLFELDGHIVVGAVDYDSGIGRVVVLSGKDGKKLWMSDPGPLADLFPAGKAVFVWCQTGYGKFDTRMTRLDGHEIWCKDFSGTGTVRPDGSLAMVVGSNESPAWDDWEYRQISPTGRVEVSLRGNGRCAVRPVCRKDGTVYFLGSILPMDPTGSRLDYTSFFAMPQEVVFQHLMGIKTQLPEYDVYLHRLRPDEHALEVIYKGTGSFSLAELQLGEGEVVLCDGRDIIAVEG